MHLLLDLGQLCAGKMRDGSSPAFELFNNESKKQEARISCLAVDEKGKKTKVLLIMEPLVLRSYKAVHGTVKSGDPLCINVINKQFKAARREYGGDYAYLEIHTDTLSRAPLAHSSTPKEESTPA